MESRGDAASARIEEIGDGGVFRSALARDRAGENPRMAIGDQALLARLQREDAAVGGFEEIHKPNFIRRWTQIYDDEHQCSVLICVTSAQSADSSSLACVRRMLWQ